MEREESSKLAVFGDGSQFKGMALDDLVDQFISIGTQAKLLQGQILLEIRQRFPSDREFGQWVSNSALHVSANHQQRTKLMNLARVFSTRDMTGISITAAYSISAPKNADVLEEIYEYAHGKSFSVKEIEEKIQELKHSFSGKSSVVDEPTPEKEEQLTAVIDINDLKKQVITLVESMPVTVVEKIFRECVSELKAKAAHSGGDG